MLALQDKEDDVKVGVKSTALRFGDSTKKWITGFGIMCIASLVLAGYNAKIGLVLFLSFIHLLKLNLISFFFLFFSVAFRNYITYGMEQGGHTMQVWELHLDI